MHGGQPAVNRARVVTVTILFPVKVGHRTLFAPSITFSHFSRLTSCQSTTTHERHLATPNHLLSESMAGPTSADLKDGLRHLPVVESII
jgi:hypothetical protein